MTYEEFNVYTENKVKQASKESCERFVWDTVLSYYDGYKEKIYRDLYSHEIKDLDILISQIKIFDVYQIEIPIKNFSNLKESISHKHSLALDMFHGSTHLVLNAINYFFEYVKTKDIKIIFSLLKNIFSFLSYHTEYQYKNNIFDSELLTLEYQRINTLLAQKS
jgi:hypothetical protein